MSDIKTLDHDSYIDMFKGIPDRTLLTVCDRDEAVWCTEGSDAPLFLCLREFAPEDYRKIRSQADRWSIRKDATTWYDPDFYANCAENEYSTSYIPIDDTHIIVKDGALFGFIFAARYTSDTLIIVFLTELREDSSNLLEKDYSHEGDIDGPHYFDYIYLVRKENDSAG